LAALDDLKCGVFFFSPALIRDNLSRNAADIAPATDEMAIRASSADMKMSYNSSEQTEKLSGGIK
jgi:hypothetical protein